MKKDTKMKLVLTGLFTFSVLFGCGQSADITKADSTKQFTKVSVEDDTAIYEHNDTGCYYLISDGYYNEGTATQMLDKDGLPYCPGAY